MRSISAIGVNIIGVGLVAGITTRGAARGGKGSKKGVLDFTHRGIETQQDLL
jgi:hypothetical protein